MKRELQHLYNTAAWRALRAAQLAKNPLCRYCEQQDRITAADTVNHRQAHKGDRALFFDPDNLESTCKQCHDGPVQSFERRGVRRGCDVNGRPLDQNHLWNRREQ